MCSAPSQGAPSAGDSPTPDGLRNDIRSAELAASAIREGTPSSAALDLLCLLDRVDASARALETAGVDLRAERARIQTVANAVVARAPVLLRALGGRSAAAELRRATQPPESRWWWYVDRLVAARRKATARRWGAIAAAVLLLLGVAATAYLAFLRPDQAARLAYRKVSDADDSVEEGAYARALALYVEALDASPGDPEILVSIGAMYEALEEAAPAAAAYSEAERLFGGRAFFLAALSQRYLRLGWWDRSELAAQQAIEEDGDLAIAYCYLASAHEAMGRTDEAIAATRLCAGKAFDAGQDELYVIATSRLGLLLQLPPVAVPIPSGTPDGNIR